MNLHEFLIKIETESKILHYKSDKDVCIIVSTKKADEIIFYFTNMKGKKFRSFKLFGFSVYPSNFINDNDFIIGFKTNL